MPIKVLFRFLFIFAIGQLSAQSPNLGILPVQNFSKKTYQGGTQNWDIAQDQRGVVYFANNEGLLEYDGVHWRKFSLSNQTIVRSVRIDAANNIYVGGQGELGFFSATESGILHYQSLVEQIPEEHRDFADIWNIVLLHDAVFFSSDTRVFRWKNEQMSVFVTGSPLSFMGKIGDAIFIHDEHRGLLEFVGDKFIIPPLKNKPNSSVTAFLPWQGDTTLISTIREGIFAFDGQSFTPYVTEMDAFFKEKRIACMTALNDGKIAIGTSVGGLLIVDNNWQPIRHIKKETGLQHTNIHTLLYDQSGNLWLGLDNGIDYVEVSSAFTFIYPDGNLQGTGYASAIKNNRLYFGNANGLYTSDWKPYFSPFASQIFEDVPNTSRQVWNLSEVNNDLILGHHDGGFLIENKTATYLPQSRGFWKAISLDNRHILAGHYTGLAIYEKNGNSWSFLRNVPNLDQSARILTIDKQGQIWVAHPYRGIYKVILSNDFRDARVTRYGAESGLPSDLFNHVFYINEAAIFAGETGLYSYNQTNDNFELNKSYSRHFKEYDRIKYLKEDKNGNVWFVADDAVGQLIIHDEGLEKRVEKRVFPELSGQLVGGFEHVYPYDAQNVFLGAEKGFIHFDPTRYHLKDSTIQVVLHEVLLTSADSLIFGGSSTQKKADILEFPSSHNAFRFTFAVPSFQNKEHIQYQTRLEGLEGDYTKWTDKSEKEYTNLSSGSYTFSVKARDGKGNISNKISYQFKVMPPWYATILAYVTYTILGLILLYLLVRFQQSNFEKEKTALQSKHQQKEALLKENERLKELEISRLRSEKLETDLAHQQKELASATLHLVQKGEMLNVLQDSLKKILKDMPANTPWRKDIRSLNQLLQQDSRLDDDWERFSYHFDQVHHDFLQRLREKYPNLSKTDRKLCAYLRMNLSTKEIAPLMNISIRGVETNRYRLRKKLDLPSEANLTEAIMNV